MTADSLGDAAGPFLGSDLGVYINLPAVTAKYGGLMTGTRLMLPRMLSSGAFGLPRMEARQTDQIAMVVGGVLQTVADGWAFAVGMNFGPTGVTVDAAVTVRPGTATARVLGGGGGVAGTLLDALPGGYAAYSAASLAVETAAAIQAAFPEYQTSAADRTPRKSATATRLGWATAGTVAGPTVEVFHPAGAIAAHLDVVRSMRAQTAHQNTPLKRLPELLPRAERLGRLVFDRVSLEYDLVAATASVTDPGVRQAAHSTMRELVGDRCDYWLATDAERGVRVTAADWAAAERLVAAYLGDGPRASDDPEARSVRRSLPADATAMLLLDAAAVTCRCGVVLHGVVDALPAFPGLELPQFVPPTGRSPFLGLAVTTKPQAVHARLVLPAAALKAAVNTVRFEPFP